MLITYFGPGDFLRTALFDGTGALSIELVSGTASQVVVRNTSNGALTTFGGRGFTADPLANPGGLVTSASFASSGGQLLGSSTGFSWPVIDFLTALSAMESNNYAPWNQLLSRQNIIFDAHAALAGAEGWFDGVTSHVNLIGSPFSDTLGGGAGNDTLNPGLSPLDGRDVLYASAGADRMVFTDVQPGRGYIQISLAELPLTGAAGASITINGAANTGSISHASGTTTLVDVARALDWHTGGFSIFGTDNNDSFTVNGGADSWIALSGSRGVDHFTLNLSGEIRLFFDGSWYEDATQALNINLATGVVVNDGFGFADSLAVTDGAGLLEIYATRFSDTITGSARAVEAYTLLGGNDTLAAGGGHDVLHYDRYAYDTGVSVDLAAGRATGYAGGIMFVHSLSGVEEVWGTNRFNDTLQGAAAAEILDGLGGNDVLAGGIGNDTLYGGIDNDALRGDDGDDLLDGGTGIDSLDGGDGNDSLIGGDGADPIYAGDGADTVEGGNGNDYIGGGATVYDRRDVIYAGAGDDYVGAGNGGDLIQGGLGNDRLYGGLGIDALYGQAGNDSLDGGAGADSLFAGDGADFLNGGAGSDRMVGGAGRDQFYHSGLAADGADWVLDYFAAAGDTLVFGRPGAERGQFQITFGTAPAAGDTAVQEVFITYKPTRQIVWALVDGAGQDHINLVLGGTTYDLLA